MIIPKQARRRKWSKSNKDINNNAQRLMQDVGSPLGGMVDDVVTSDLNDTSQTVLTDVIEKPVERLKKLRDAVDRGGTHANANFLAYLAILIYFFVAVTSTTHEDLLREANKSVPLLNIQLPLWWFFLIGPFALVLIHLNLLVQYYYLTQNVIRFDDFLKSVEKNTSTGSELANEERDLPLNFALSNLILDRDMPGVLRAIMKMMLWVFIVLLPTSVLLLFQVYFLPYHDVFVTWSHRLLFVFDSLMLLMLWQVISRAQDRRRGGLQGMSVSINPVVVFRRVPISVLVVATMMPVSMAMLTIPGETIGNFRHDVLVGLFPGLSKAKDAIGDEGFVLNAVRKVDNIVKRNLVLSNRLLIKNDPAAELIAQYAGTFANHDLIVTQLAEKYKLGLNLQGRDLRFADFRGARLPAALFRNANLEQASFNDAHIEHAIFNGANISDVEFDRASAAGASFSHAKMRGNSFEGAIIKGADMTVVNISGANFSKADLSGVEMWKSVIIDTDFSGANLSASKIWDSEFVNTVFRETVLDDSDLSKSIFSGCSMASAGINNANLRSSQLIGTVLIGAKANGANLSNADMMGSYLRSASFIGADLSGARLVGVCLENADFEGADLTDTDLSVSDVRGANFKASNMNGAKMNNVDARNALFGSVDFSLKEVRNSDLRGASFVALDSGEWHNLVERVISSVPLQVRGDVSKRLAELKDGIGYLSYEPSRPVDSCFGPRSPLLWGKPDVCTKDTILNNLHKRGLLLNEIACINVYAAKSVSFYLRTQLKGTSKQKVDKSVVELFINGNCDVSKVLRIDELNELKSYTAN